AQGLGGAVEVAGAEVVAPHQGANGAVVGVQGHQGGLDPGDLGQPPVAFLVGLDADQVAAAEHLAEVLDHRRTAVFGNEFADAAIVGEQQLPGGARGQQQLGAILAHCGDDGGVHGADCRGAGQGLPPVVGSGDVGLGTPVAVAQVIGFKPPGNRGVGLDLELAVDGGGDQVALGVGVQAPAVDGFLASHFRHIGGADLCAGAVVAGVVPGGEGG